MKKNLPPFLIVLLVYSSTFSQEGLYQFSKSYFRSDPLIGEFSGFLKHLINDPTITNKEIQLRTDSSLFYFAGVYNNYNPFFFKPARVESTLKETIIQYADSIPPDTIFVYQLLAYADTTHKSEQEVKKEFSKIHRHFNRKFYSSKYQEFKTGSIVTGGVHHYFVAFASLAPASIAWSHLQETKEYVLNIMLRFKTNENKVVLAAPFNQSQ